MTTPATVVVQTVLVGDGAGVGMLSVGSGTPGSAGLLEVAELLGWAAAAPEGAEPDGAGPDGAGPDGAALLGAG